MMEDLEADKQSVEPKPPDPAVPGPVYFLVREQAKSVVAIKDLETRLKYLEGIQEDVVFALRDLQDQVAKQHQHLSRHSGLKHLEERGSGSTKKKAILSEADSGLDSDQGCLAIAQDTFGGGSGAHDELLSLLDLIDQKGASLKQHVEELEKIVQESKHDSSQEVDRLLTEKTNLQQMLTAVENEKAELKAKLRDREHTSQQLKSEITKLQSSLEMALSEKQQLESRINNLHMHSFKGIVTSNNKTDGSNLNLVSSEVGCSSTKSPRPAFMGRKSWSSNLENHVKVAAILRETNLVELQRQLLINLMEYEVLQAKLAQADQALSLKNSECLKLETSLHYQIKKLTQEKEELKIQLQEGKLELTAVQAKAKMLERILTSITQEKDLNLADSLSNLRINNEEGMSHKSGSCHNESDGKHGPPSLYDELCELPSKVEGEKCAFSTPLLKKVLPSNKVNFFNKSINFQDISSIQNKSTEGEEIKSPKSHPSLPRTQEPSFDSAIKDIRRIEDRKQRQKWLRQAFQALLASPVQSHEAAKIIHKASEKSPGELQHQLQTILERFPTNSEEAMV